MVMRHLRNKKTQKKIWILLTIIILPAFLFWGLSGRMNRSRKQASYAGRIFGRKIPVQEYRDAYQGIIIINLLRWGDENFQKLASLIDLKQETWNRLILTYEAKRQRLSVSDKEIRQAIENSPNFQRKGKFDFKIYRELVQYTLHTTPRAYEEEVRSSLLISKLFDKTTKDIKLTEDDIKVAFNQKYAQISVDYAVALFMDISKSIGVSDNEIQDYYNLKSADFRKPLYLNIDYIVIPFLKNAGESETKAFEEKINTIALRLNEENADISQIAKDFSLKLNSTGLFAADEPIPGIGFAQQLTNIITQLKENQTSPLIYAEDACYIVRLKEKKVSYTPNFLEIKDKIRDTLLISKTIEKAKKDIVKASGKIKQGADFFKASRETGLKTGSIGLFKRGGTLRDLGEAQPVFDAAIKLKTGQVSDAVDVSLGLCIVRLKDIELPDEEIFNKEKENFSKELLLDKKEKFFNEFFLRLRSEARLEDNTQALRIE